MSLIISLTSGVTSDRNFGKATWEAMAFRSPGDFTVTDWEIYGYRRKAVDAVGASSSFYMRLDYGVESAVSGVYNPANSAFVSTNRGSAAIVTTAGWISATITTSPIISSGKWYAVVASDSVAYDALSWCWTRELTPALANANFAESVTSGTTWSANSAADYLFRVYGTPIASAVGGGFNFGGMGLTQDMSGWGW